MGYLICFEIIVIDSRPNNKNGINPRPGRELLGQYGFAQVVILVVL